MGDSETSGVWTWDLSTRINIYVHQAHYFMACLVTFITYGVGLQGSDDSRMTFCLGKDREI